MYDMNAMTGTSDQLCWLAIAFQNASSVIGYLAHLETSTLQLLGQQVSLWASDTAVHQYTASAYSLGLALEFHIHQGRQITVPACR